MAMKRRYGGEEGEEQTNLLANNVIISYNTIILNVMDEIY